MISATTIQMLRVNRMEIKVHGWEYGFAKVQASKLFRAELNMNIAGAKQVVDRILAGEEVTILAKSEEHAVSLCEELRKLGAKANVC